MRRGGGGWDLVGLAAMVMPVLACGRIHFDAGPTDASDAPSTDAPRFTLDAGQCPPSYTFLGTSCYRMLTTQDADWLANEALCEADAVGAHLVVVDDVADVMVIASFIPVIDEWVGISDRISQGNFRTVTGVVPPYLMWEPNQPNTMPGYDCVYLTNALGQLGTDTCDRIDDLLCEYDGVPADPSAF